VDVEVAAQQVACLGVPLCDGAVLVARDDVLGEVGEAGDGGLALVADYPRGVLVALGGIDVGVDLVDDDGGQVPGALLGDTQQLAAVGRELDALDGGGKLPCLQQPAGLDLPQAHRVVGAAGRDHLGGGVDVDGPQGTDVAVVCAQTLAVVRIYVLSAGGARSAGRGRLTPCAHNMVLGDGKDQVAVGVVFDLGERALVPGEKNRPHVCGVCGSGGAVRRVGVAFMLR
jgi:hypothetical protein